MPDQSTANEPVLLDGGLGIDDRGQVAFVNDFTFEKIKRFYTVANHKQGFIRAWHGHRYEAKYVYVVTGTALVCAVRVADWERPDPAASVYRYVLSAERPATLFIPPGFANGFMSLTQDAKLIFFSTSTVEESRNDDIRFEARLWNPWTISER